MEFKDRRLWCQRCGSLEGVRIFTMSGGKLASGKAKLCESCTRDVFGLVRLVLANQPVTVDPVPITPPPELPEFPDDMGDRPLFGKGDRVIPEGRNDPRLPGWTSGAHLAAEPGVVEEVRRWGDSPGGVQPIALPGQPSHMADIDQLWVYHIRCADGTFTTPLTAYQLRACEPK